MKKKNNKKIIFVSIILVFLGQVVLAEEEILPPPPDEIVTEEPPPEPIPEPEVVPEVEFSIKDGEFVLEESVPFPEEGNVSIEGHDVNARSVLAVLYALDGESSAFEISELIYYSSFSAFYVKCITLQEEKCDYWMYKVNGESPSVGMDSFILSAADQVEIYFDSSFFGSADEEEKEKEGSPPEEEQRQTSGGGSSRRKTKVEPKEESVLPEVSVETVPVAETVPTPPVIQPVAAPKVAKVEEVSKAEEKIPEPMPPAPVLTAAVAESDSSTNIPLVIGGALVALVLIFLGRRFLIKN